jgi:hypothetical protein
MGQALDHDDEIKFDKMIIGLDLKIIHDKYYKQFYLPYFQDFVVS